MKSAVTNFQPHVDWTPQDRPDHGKPLPGRPGTQPRALAGPSATLREHPGGFYVIRVDNFDQAMALSRRVAVSLPCLAA